MKKYGIKRVFKPHKKLTQFLNPVKDKILFNTEDFYKIPFICGKIYRPIGQTGRPISSRVQEHVRHTKNLATQKSAVPEHSVTTK